MHIGSTPQRNGGSATDASESYKTDAFDISSGLPLPGETLGDKINLLKERAQYGVESDGETFLRLQVDGVRFRVGLSTLVRGSGPQYRLRIGTDNDVTCLSMHIGLDFKSDTADIRSNARCPFYPVPKSKMGDLILTIADKLCGTLGVVSNEVFDVSTISCGASGGNVSLGLLHILRDGQTWYENHAYVPTEFDGSALSEDRVTELKKNRNLLATATVRDLVGTAPFERFSEHDAKSLDTKLSTLLLESWKENCGKYMRIVADVSDEPSDIGAAFRFFIPTMIKTYKR